MQVTGDFCQHFVFDAIWKAIYAFQCAEFESLLDPFSTIKLLQFDNKDTSTSFIFRVLIMEINAFDIAALI